MNDALIVLLVFALSFLFSLGGVGSATAIVPILVFLGESFNMAKNTGLFVNTLSSSMSTYHHHQKGGMEWKMAISLALPSVFLAPLGAMFSQRLSHEALLIIFAAFLVYSATVLLFLKKSGEREPKVVQLIGVGTLSGFAAGLLGIGGGAIISPILILMGVNPRRVARLTPVAVLFSSLSGFLTYSYMGFIDLKLLAIVAIPAVLGGYLGAHTMHHRMDEKQIKMVIGVIFYILAIKAILSVL